MINIVFILFTRGSAGNFLTRLITLDPTTICLGSNDLLTADERYSLYSYNNYPTLPITTFNSQEWFLFEKQIAYPTISRGIEKINDSGLLAIEGLHPDNYSHMMSLFGVGDSVRFISIDTSDCDEWVIDQRLNKKVGGQIDKISIKKSIIEDRAFINSIPVIYSISLKNILNADNFLNEYHNIASTLGLEIFDDLAVRLYQNWKHTWA